ncbi:MAG: hypothetical protein LLF97_01885 [Planctomycetaceae bacterium]|nr:hypothetical protein [Planctomycetaceae bacterium]
MMIAKQSTALVVCIGPILDEDGLPYVVASIASTAFRLSKNGGSGASPHSTTGAVQDGDQGHYRLTLDATDTATLGSLDVSLELAGYAMPICRATIATANVYDSMVSGTDELAVDVASLLGAALTETGSGYLAASLTKFLDVASPVFTAECVNQTMNVGSGVTLADESSAIGPLASTTDQVAGHEDIGVNAFRNSSPRLCARVLLNGADVQQADVSTIVYSIYLLDDADADARTAVEGHSAVSLSPADVIFDTLQSDAQASDYNFRHQIPVSVHDAFTIAGRKYLVEYTMTPASGERVLFRFRVNVR